MSINNLFLYVKVLLSVRQDEGRAFKLLSRFASYIMPEYRLTGPETITWWYNSQFNPFLHKFDELDNYNTHRKWMVKQLMRMVQNVPGDTAECGVYKGASSYLMLQANSASPHSKTHHIFDSFEGLSSPETVDGEHWTKGDLAYAESLVKENLLPFESGRDYICYLGWIPTRFCDVEKVAFSFVHIDVDLYQPTKDSIEFFYPRVANGGIIVCDDYGFNSCPGATKAIDEFLLDKHEKMIALSSGGGFLIKGVFTGT